MAPMPKRKPRDGMDEYGRTPLWYCALRGDVAGIASELAGGANVNQADDAGLTPLHAAVQERKIEAIKLLLERGANPNAQDARGNVPIKKLLSQANAPGAIEVIQLLLQAGADPHLPNARGGTPYALAQEIGHGLEKLFDGVSTTKKKARST